MHEIPYIIVACDPNGGGDSQMALVSVAFLRGAMIIVGLESHAVRGHDQIKDLLMTHINALHDVWRNAWLIFVAESNLGQEADHMRSMLKHTGRTYVVCENGLSGVRTTNARKELYSMELCKFMAQDGFGLHDSVVTVNPFAGEHKGRDVIDLLRRQLMGYRKIVLKSTTGRSEPRVCYTGKAQGAQDDLVVTATIAAYWGVQFLTQRIPGVPYDRLRE